MDSLIPLLLDNDNELIDKIQNLNDSIDTSSIMNSYPNVHSLIQNLKIEIDNFISNTIFLNKIIKDGNSNHKSINESIQELISTNYKLNILIHEIVFDCNYVIELLAKIWSYDEQILNQVNKGNQIDESNRVYKVMIKLMKSNNEWAEELMACFIAKIESSYSILDELKDLNSKTVKVIKQIKYIKAFNEDILDYEDLIKQFKSSNPDIQNEQLTRLFDAFTLIVDDVDRLPRIMYLKDSFKLIIKDKQTVFISLDSIASSIISMIDDLKRINDNKQDMLDNTK